MIPTTLTSTTPPPAEELLAPALGRAHAVWIKQARRFLLPATLDTASFWERWTAVRYLADQFVGQYRRERALIDELRPFLAPGRVERLCRDAERIEQIRLGLDNLGRRRGTAPKVAAASRELLALLAQWCSEIENAASLLPISVLSREAARLLTELETFSQLHA